MKTNRANKIQHDLWKYHAGYHDSANSVVLSELWGSAKGYNASVNCHLTKWAELCCIVFCFISNYTFRKLNPASLKEFKGTLESYSQLCFVPAWRAFCFHPSVPGCCFECQCIRQKPREAYSLLHHFQGCWWERERCRQEPRIPIVELQSSLLLNALSQRVCRKPLKHLFEQRECCCRQIINHAVVRWSGVTVTMQKLIIFNTNPSWSVLFLFYDSCLTMISVFLLIKEWQIILFIHL